MRYPEFLKDNGRIGFVAPSFGCSFDPYYSRQQSAIALFQEMGYETVPGPNCFLAEGNGKSNTPEKCGGELNDFFLNKDVGAILSVGGGETMCEDLPFVDFEGIRKAKPVWYMGYSDNTCLTYTLPVLCDTATVYGPCATTFGRLPWHKSVEDAFRVITGKGYEIKDGVLRITLSSYDGWEPAGESPEGCDPLAPYSIEAPLAMRLAGPRRPFSGRLIGGCMDLLFTLQGTRFDKTKEFVEKYKDDGIVWFLEACEMSPVDLRRVLWGFENAGWFEHVSGFIFGRPMVYGTETFGFDQYNAVTGILEKYNVPIVMDADLGHLPPQIPIITGSVAEVTASEEKLTITMKLK